MYCGLFIYLVCFLKKAKFQVWRQFLGCHKAVFHDRILALLFFEGRQREKIVSVICPFLKMLKTNLRTGMGGLDTVTLIKVKFSVI